MDDVTKLICEGDCNPDIRDIDAQISLHRRKEFGLSLRRSFPIDTSLAARVRALQYTDHARVGNTTTYVCCRCGHTRRYGLTTDDAPRRRRRAAHV